MTELTQIKRILEGAILAADTPLTVDQLGQLFLEDERPENADIRAALQAIMNDCDGRGFELVEVASGWRFQTCQDLSTWVGRMWEEKPARYSRALLETLALIAYRQPVTRGEIEQVRGVSVSSNIIRTLLEREWIRVVGHRDVPGRPAMYATTKIFLDYFNLKNLDDLPTLAEIKDMDKLNEELKLSGEVLLDNTRQDSAQQDDSLQDDSQQDDGERAESAEEGLDETGEVAAEAEEEMVESEEEVEQQ